MTIMKLFYYIKQAIVILKDVCGFMADTNMNKKYKQ